MPPESPSHMAERDYRDDYPLSEAIADAYNEGLVNGQSWGTPSGALPTDERDYAMARADRLEAALASRPSPLQGLPEFEEVVTDILVALFEVGRLDADDGPDIDDARDAVMRTLESYFPAAPSPTAAPLVAALRDYVDRRTNMNWNLVIRALHKAEREAPAPSPTADERRVVAMAIREARVESGGSNIYDLAEAAIAALDAYRAEAPGGDSDE